MSTSIEKTYATREDAELAVERLVQQVGLARTDIFVASAGDENSAGDSLSGGDAPVPLEDGRDDAALAGGITVSVDINDPETSQAVRAALDSASGG
ncbi:hypothetical protein [Novosphingobium gossypii]|uniref:hypothetical protein n=1 Tax=Novosphingobium gossypii TaxID=1604774 RepID=UPI003D1FE3F6